MPIRVWLELKNFAEFTEIGHMWMNFWIYSDNIRIMVNYCHILIFFIITSISGPKYGIFNESAQN